MKAMENTAPTSASESKPYDLLIAGGGIAGILAAAKFAAAHPNSRILLVERETVLGGRLRQSSPQLPRPGYGLSGISDALYGEWQDALVAHGLVGETSMLPGSRQQTVGVLAGNRLAQQTIDLWFTPKGARILGGIAASKHWPEVEEIVRQGAVAAPVDDADEDLAGGDDEAAPAQASKAAKSHALGHYWKQTRKAPAAIVLEHFGSAFGIPDVWDAAPEALAQRASFHSGRLHCGDWSEVITSLMNQPSFQTAVSVSTGNRIVNADLQDGIWHVNAEKGQYQATALIVAQPPWQATAWLKRTLWPPALLQVASKTKPVSVVVLSEKIISSEATNLLPDVTIVPSERVQIVRDGTDAVYFQATIDFELSLQAPAVVKAVKALKRARKKLQQLHPGAVTESNFIALLPVAWAQSPLHGDRRWLMRLGQKNFNAANLAFCGDAYGPSYDGDANILKSLTSACETLKF
ncbi:MAG: FAD-dependent oxidoreductase [Proteobacteria bacterium]|nr:FAD-dependent oxidoreductase [Pseudomonadota bacterium]